MRNLVQYPVTQQEVLVFLENLQKEQSQKQMQSMQVGGIDGAIINGLITLVSQNPDVVKNTFDLSSFSV